jgi:hypothetical protein
VAYLPLGHETNGHIDIHSDDRVAYIRCDNRGHEPRNEQEVGHPQNVASIQMAGGSTSLLGLVSADRSRARGRRVR